jgi:AAA15 family ATPase/GTPase
MSEELEQGTPQSDGPEIERTQSSDRRNNVSLKNLYLDPNNYRFIDAESYVRVPSNDSPTREDIQRRTFGLILERNAENIKDLIESFRKNGFLPVDQIQVKQLGNGRYLVVEGNRRVACLKYLQRRYEQEGFDLGRLDPAIFQRVPVVYYQDADDAHHLILMGLKHISGNKKWPAINQAELIRDLAEKHAMSPDDICQSISISRKEYNLTLSTLRLIERYRASDLGQQFSTDMYSIFREITRNAALKLWLGWNDKDGTASKPENLERLFSWISTDEIDEDADEDGDYYLGGQRLEAVITKATHVRELAKIIDDEVALKNVDATRSLIQASMSSELLGKNRVANSVSLIGQELTQLFSMVKHLNNSQRLDLKGFTQKISAILEAGGVVDIPRSHAAPILNGKNFWFRDISVDRFRKLQDIKLSALGQINIIAGVNNSGKTSLLEGIELLANLSRFKSVLDILSRRTKLREDELNSEWVFSQVPEWAINASIKGVEIAASCKKEVEEGLEQAFYIGSLNTSISYGDQDFSSVTRIYDKYPYQTHGSTRPLLPVQFNSPYQPHSQERLISAYQKALEAGLKPIVVEFINQHVDKRFADIELAKDRFLVRLESGNSSQYMDLANFGDGIQRIFAIAVLFAAAKGGILMLDEAESAIHSSLFERFARLIYVLSEKFEVQVFLSTHSKECIDSFVQANDVPRSAVVGYALYFDGIQTKAVRIGGERLVALISSINFDMRSVHV